MGHLCANMRISTLMMLILASFCLAAEEQGNQRKNIKLLFVPADVMVSLRKNLTTKDLLGGLNIGSTGQATQRWTPVRLPGDKTHSFEMRLNPRTAHKLNLSFRHLRIGRGHGLLLELKNVSLSTLQKNVLDKLVEFYRNCGSGRRAHNSMMHRLRRPVLPFMPHSLMVPGDIPLLRRIQNALERFFPRRHDGSVEVVQHKDSNGAVHFLPFDEVRREVDNLLKRTIANKDCIKISTDFLTRALQAFRSENNNSTNKISTTSVVNNKSTGKGDVGNVIGDSQEVNNEVQEDDNILSFDRNLASLDSDRRNKVNFTSGVNVPNDDTTSSMASVLAKLRRAIRLFLASYKGNLSLPSSDKEHDNPISVGGENKTKTRVSNILKAISSDESEKKNENRNKQQLSFDLSEATNRIKVMSSDKSDNKNNKSGPIHDNSRLHADPVKIKTDDMRAGQVNTSTSLMDAKKDVSKVAQNSTSSAHGFEAHDYSSLKLSNANIESLVQLIQALKKAKSLRIYKPADVFMGNSKGTETVNKNKSSKVGRYKRPHKYKHRNKTRVKEKYNIKQQSIVFHFKPKSMKHEMYTRFKDGQDDDEDQVDEGGSEKYIGKGSFTKLHRKLKRKPQTKETTVEDDDDYDSKDNDIHKQVDDYPTVERENYEENDDGILRKLRHSSKHVHGSRKSPKLRVVVYDDDEDEKEPHNDMWQNSESEELAGKLHQDDNEAITASPDKTSDGSDTTLYREDQNNRQLEQGETTSEQTSNSDSDVQYLADSIGTDENRQLGESQETEVPNLEPYLKKHYNDEEGEESEEIKMFNNQDDKFGDEMEKRISKASNQDYALLNAKVNPMDNIEDKVPEIIRMHNLPFTIQEDSNGEDTSLLEKQRKGDSLGTQQALVPGRIPSVVPFMPSSQPVAMTSFAPTASQGIDLSPNVVMPAEQTTVIPATGELPQMAGGSPIERPGIGAFSRVNYQPSMASQMNSMMPQMPYPQFNSMMPMQPGVSNVATPWTPAMLPGQTRAYISRGSKMKTTSGIKRRQALKKRHVHKSKTQV